MASAAPAAPAAAPQAPAADATNGLASPTAPTSADLGAASSPKKGLKPIPKQKIPGVKTWAAQNPPTSAPEAPSMAPETATEPKFTIGGKEYSQADLEKAFLTLEGRKKANERDAQAWRKHQKELSEAPQAPVSRETRREAPEAPQAPQEVVAKRWIEAQGEAFWNQYRQVHEQHGPEVAAAFLADKFDSSMNERMQGLEQQILAKLAPALTPILQEHVDAKNKHFANDIWSEFATYTNDETGEPLFPELAQNPQLAQIAGHFWLGLRQKYGDKFAMSEYGLYSAFRDAQAYLTSEAEQGKNAGDAAQAVLDAIEYDRKAGARTAIQAPSAPPVSAPEANPNDASAVNKRIRDAGGSFIKTKTGFQMGVRPLAGGGR